MEGRVVVDTANGCPVLSSPRTSESWGLNLTSSAPFAGLSSQFYNPLSEPMCLERQMPVCDASGLNIKKSEGLQAWCSNGKSQGVAGSASRIQLMGPERTRARKNQGQY